MKKLFHKKKAIPYLLFSLILILSCCRKNLPVKPGNMESVSEYKATELVSPLANKVITCGDSVLIEVKLKGEVTHIDSIIVQEGRKGKTAFEGQNRVYWSSSDSRTGKNTLKINVYFNDSLHESHAVSLLVKSDIVPVNYNYKVISRFPHDRHAYTQGLIYYQGKLIESTGLEGQSSVRFVDISTGNVLKIVPLESQFFGEGIALYKDMIYQVTYRSKVGFIYNINTLELIRRFDYQIREGWGLTSDGTRLIMSDGSSLLYFIEPELFTQTDQIEVYDNVTQYDSLNELEYINGKILANVYGQTYILIIDPATGKVTGKIELRNLMPEGSIGDYGKVLNGIAYNPQTLHLYVTGKNWPVLYEIALEPSL